MEKFLFVGNSDAGIVLRENLIKIFPKSIFKIATPQSAISVTEMFKPDVIFIDKLFDSFRHIYLKLKKGRSTVYIPLVLLLDSKQREIGISAIESGIDTIIHFPGSSVDLELQVRILLKNRNQYFTELEKLIGIIDNDIPVSLWLVNVEKDDKFRYVYQNQHARDTGIPDEQVICKTLNDLTPKYISEEDAQKTINLYKQCIDTGKVTTTEQMVLVEGKEIWWRTTFSPLKNDNNTVYRILVSSLVISEQKQTEKLLAESEKSYRNIFENNPQPMWIYDVETLRFLKVNRAAIEQYGYSEQEFLSMTIKDIRPSEDIPKLLSDIEISNRVYKNIGEGKHVKKTERF